MRDKSKILSVLSERLREIRAGYGMGQKKFALYLDENGVPCDYYTYKNWENGRCLPHLEVLEALADLLEVDLDYLLGRQEAKRKEYDSIRNYTGINYKASEYLHALYLTKLENREGTTAIDALSEFITQKKFWEILGSIKGLEEANYYNSRYEKLSEAVSEGQSKGLSMDPVAFGILNVYEELDFPKDIRARKYELSVMFSNLLEDLLKAPEE